MQNSMTIDALQVRPAGINLKDGIQAIKCETKRLLATKSETFSWMCEESVTYGEILATVAGTVALFAFMFLVGFLAGGEVA